MNAAALVAVSTPGTGVVITAIDPARTLPPEPGAAALTGTATLAVFAGRT
ncbi:MAG: hypothetical protein U0800_27680 [Isosphaeraceae bacterium]